MILRSRGTPCPPVASNGLARNFCADFGPFHAGEAIKMWALSTPLLCHPERSRSVRRMILRSRGTPCPPVASNGLARNFCADFGPFHAGEAIKMWALSTPILCHPERSRSVRRMILRSRGTPCPPVASNGLARNFCPDFGPFHAGEAIKMWALSTPLLCHPERSRSVRRTILRSRGTPCPPVAGNGLARNFCPDFGPPPCIRSNQTWALSTPLRDSQANPF